MNPSRSLFHGAGTDSYDDLLQNAGGNTKTTGTPTNFSFLDNQNYQSKHRNFLSNSLHMGDGGDRFSLNSTDKSFLANHNKEELFKSFKTSPQKWRKSFGPTPILEEEGKENYNLDKDQDLDKDKDEKDFEVNDYNNTTAKFISPSHSSYKDVDLEKYNDLLDSDLLAKKTLSYNSLHEQQTFKDSFMRTMKEEKYDMNMLMVVGLFIALLAAKCLKYLEFYMEWFKHQIEQLRMAFLDDVNAWEIFDFDKEARINFRSKLILVPILIICGILKGVITMMHFTIRLMLAPAPHGLVQIIQKLGSDKF